MMTVRLPAILLAVCLYFAAASNAWMVNGTFAFNAGTLNITGFGGLTIGSGGAFGSILSLGPGHTLNVTTTTTIESGATLILENAANLFFGYGR
jgi:hypothetical protein